MTADDSIILTDLTAEWRKCEFRCSMHTVLLVKSSRADVLESILVPCRQLNKQE